MLRFLFGFSTDDSENELTSRSTLSPYCRKENMKTMNSPHGINIDTSSSAILSQTLKRAVKYIQIRKFSFHYQGSQSREARLWRAS